VCSLLLCAGVTLICVLQYVQLKIAFKVETLVLFSINNSAVHCAFCSVTFVVFLKSVVLRAS